MIPAITSARVFNCTREKLFSTWSNPQLLARWWGPNGFTNTIHAFNFSAGGEWKLTMHGPDGTDYYNQNLFTEITAPAKIVFQHLEPVHTFTATAIFEEAGNNTLLSFSMLFDEQSEYDKLKAFIAAANEENFDRLASLLSQLK